MYCVIRGGGEERHGVCAHLLPLKGLWEDNMNFHKKYFGHPVTYMFQNFLLDIGELRQVQKLFLVKT